jgi:hypothetical protein
MASCSWLRWALPGGVIFASAAEELRSVGSPLSAAVLVCSEGGVAPG